ncbi:MAG: mannose-1-phosphate guanylyltransferase/mannose-6-phosphate isomerase [Alphaproteobacteria bacterium]|nr:mannose-1-phosphate guanylyltransferase/mannose-6-phosphate isomerase [Alphaproteobacteria bacterium]
MATIHPVILSGGSGTRLWPVSRALFPKQLLALAGTHTMLQETALRVRDPAHFAEPMVICNAEHRFIVAEQLRQINIAPSDLILEPEGRNTAPAAALAALRVARTDPDGLVLLLASDHVVTKPDILRAAILSGVAAAEQDRLVTFGIRPHRPETGYGHIKVGAEIDGAPGCHGVDRFVEKPDFETAKAYVASGDYMWNASLFLFKARVYLQELKHLAPEIEAACRAALEGASEDLGFTLPEPDAFAGSPSISIDYAVMEKTDKAAVVPVDPGWSDVGSWTALWEISEQDEHANALIGDVAAHDVRNAMIRAESRQVTAIGVENVIIAETSDAVLVVGMNHAQDVKLAVDGLKATGRPEATAHALVHRPWGTFEGIDDGPTYQVKRITVTPGAALSLQSHEKRSEHWVVISGAAKVTRGASLDTLETQTLSRNQSIDIPLGWIHRLENQGDDPLVIIEVQSGDYLGEDDIARYDDVYGRG